MRLLVISMDACSNKDFERLISLKNIRKIMEKGAFCKNVQTIYPSITYPVHASLLTGTYPKTHGISHNQIFDKDKTPKERAWHWQTSDIKARTLFEAARDEGLSCASLFWPVVGKDKNVKYLLPEVLALKGENQTLKALDYGSKVWLIMSGLKHGKLRDGAKQPKLDEFSSALAADLIKKNGPDMIFLHLVAVDSLRHEHGVDSREAIYAMECLDKNIGLLLEKIEKTGLEYAVCLVSDHGQADVSEHFCLNSEFEKAGLKMRAQSLGFGAYIHLLGESYESARDFLFKNMERLKISHVYEKAELESLKAGKEVLLAVEAREGIEFLDFEEGTKERGNHGFSPSNMGSKVLFFLCAKGIKKNYCIDRMDVVDVAPTLARLMGLRLVKAEGRVVEEIFE